jgi:hypothetical protein
MIKVVNVRRERPAGMIYVGRACAGFAGSVLGNPYHRRPEDARGSTLADYRQWLREQYRAGGSVRQELERLADMAERRDTVLGCWCKPAPCHADIVAEAVEGIIRQRQQKRGQG